MIDLHLCTVDQPLISVALTNGGPRKMQRAHFLTLVQVLALAEHKYRFLGDF